MVLQDKSIIRIQGTQQQRRLFMLQQKKASCIPPEKDYFTVSNRLSSERITEHVWHTK